MEIKPWGYNKQYYSSNLVCHSVKDLIPNLKGPSPMRKAKSQVFLILKSCHFSLFVCFTSLHIFFSLFEFEAMDTRKQHILVVFPLFIVVKLSLWACCHCNKL